MKIEFTPVLRIAVAVLALVLLAGCAGVGARTRDLLSQDYHAMNDMEIQTYFYQLNDQIAREERAARGTSVGVGVGTGPVSVGASQEVTRGRIAEDLRDRRNEVRAELSRRGLMP
jgi:hypothetical protein